VSSGGQIAIYSHQNIFGQLTSRHREEMARYVLLASVAILVLASGK